jgi:gluconate 2-dehydrogenase subunit 3-like protein
MKNVIDSQVHHETAASERQPSTVNSQPWSVDRRTAIKWVMAAASAVHLPTFANLAFADRPASAQGYGKDPKLVDAYHVGDVWPLTLSPQQRKTAQVLSDLILPADDASPAASSVGVVDFIDEWISAPYSNFVADRKIMLDGLAWLDQEAQRRFGKMFAQLSNAQLTTICDDLATANPGEELRSAATFFARYRELTTGGFYTTPVGMKDIGYVGNVPLTSFDGPPKDVLKKLGIV